MAGRGHGRGRRMMSFSVEAVGISRADSLPASIQQPTPVYPVMEQKPLPLTGGEEAEYLLALKQEFRGAMRSLPCFIQPAAPQKDVERYSDKYHNGEQTDHLIQWTPDWKRLPKELRVHVKRRRTQGVAVEAHCTDGVQADQKKKKKKKKSGSEKEEVLLTLETLEKKENQESSEEEEEGDNKKKQEEEEAEGEEEYDEEEFEEETDYIMSYFDNGEEFGGDSDDNMDEAIY
ncbi:DNA-directed RNA polymerase III subunit RPC7-like [Sphaeramia orbicularis]|uniref:DNA-directed RNA polymerase III subunit RPC7-like n=1 Tax=Sphaeramia orbicularis TaxID=375764 RepID=UPI00118046F9|nr:DNA-directed RNA polymerase III subunit RPC7-like [Sphaeramia orbicularis]